MQDNKQTPKPAASPSLVTNLVSDIPIQTQAAPKQLSEDDELDTIMRDVGKDVKQIGKEKPKHGLFHRDKKPKSGANFSARPIDQIKPPPAAPPPKPASITSSPPPQKAVQPIAKPRASKTHSAPAGVIFLALIMTGGLIAAAYFAYK